MEVRLLEVHIPEEGCLRTGKGLQDSQAQGGTKVVRVGHEHVPLAVQDLAVQSIAEMIAVGAYVGVSMPCASSTSVPTPHGWS